MNNQTKCLTGGVLAAVAVLFTVLVRIVDVDAVGPAGTAVGFSHLNLAFSRIVGYNAALYKLTSLLGTLGLAFAAAMAAVGLVQMVKRRSLLKLDRPLLALAGLYAVTLGLYGFFEIVIINYRPLIMPGETVPEASFPSSHTMLSFVIFGSAALLAGYYVKENRLRQILRGLCIAAVCVMVIGRACSGVHWLTDITGGVLYGSALLFLYAGAAGENGGKS